MTKTLRILTLSVASLLPLGAAEPASYLPQDSTIVFSATDAKTLNSLDEHPLIKAILTEDIRRAFGPLLAEMKEAEADSEKIWKEETGLSVDEAMAQFGDFTMSMRVPIKEISEAMEKDPSTPPFEIFLPTFAADFKGDEAMIEKFAKAYVRAIKLGMEKTKEKNADTPFPFPTDLEETTDDHSGVKLHIWKSKAEKSPMQISWAYLDKNIIVSFTEKGLRDAIDRSKKGGASLAENPRYRDVVTRGKGAEVLGYVDLAKLIEEGVKMAAESAPDGTMVTAMVSALGVDKFSAAYFTVDIQDKSVDAEGGVTFSQKPAVLDVIAVDGPGKEPDFIPSTVNSAGYGTFHWDRVLPAIEKIVSAVAPEALDMINKQLAEIKEVANVDIRKDVLANLGPDLFTASVPAKGEAQPSATGLSLAMSMNEPQVLGVKLKDPKAIELALKSLINMFASGASIFDEREVQGYKINNLKGVPMPVGWALVEDWLIVSVGEQALLEQILARIKKPGSDSIFALPDVKAAVAGLPGGDDGTSYMDIGSFIGSILGVLRDLPEMPELKQVVDVKKLPENLKIPVIMAIRTYLDDQSVRFRAHIVEKTK